MRAKCGRFVVLEGIDGAGTTTQTAKLAEWFGQKGRSVRTTREPSDGPIGMLIRQVLSGRIVSSGGRAPGWTTMALLFAADRVDHVENEIEPFVKNGGIVISDRYDASSLAYQSITSGVDVHGAVEWLAALNRHALRPDLTIVLDCPAEVAAERRRARGEASQLYEQNEVQQALAVFYTKLPAFMPKDRIVSIPAAGPVDEVHGQIIATCEGLLS